PNRPDTTESVDKKCRRATGQRKGAEWFEALGPGEPSVDLRIGGNVQFSSRELQQGNLPVSAGDGFLQSGNCDEKVKEQALKKRERITHGSVEGNKRFDTGIDNRCFQDGSASRRDPKGRDAFRIDLW